MLFVAVGAVLTGTASLLILWAGTILVRNDVAVWSIAPLKPVLVVDNQPGEIVNPVLSKKYLQEGA